MGAVCINACYELACFPVWTAGLLQRLMKRRGDVYEHSWRVHEHDVKNSLVTWVHDSDRGVQVMTAADRRGRVDIYMHYTDFSKPADATRLRGDLALGIERVSGIVAVFASLQPCVGDNGKHPRLAKRRQGQFELWKSLSNGPLLRELPWRCDGVVGVCRDQKKNVSALVLCKKDGATQIRAASCAWFVAGGHSRCAACEARKDTWSSQERQEIKASKPPVGKTVGKTVNHSHKASTRRHDSYTVLELRATSSPCPTSTHELFCVCSTRETERLVF